SSGTISVFSLIFSLSSGLEGSFGGSGSCGCSLSLLSMGVFESLFLPSLSFLFPFQFLFSSFLSLFPQSYWEVGYAMHPLFCFSCKRYCSDVIGRILGSK